MRYLPLLAALALFGLAGCEDMNRPEPPPVRPEEQQPPNADMDSTAPTKVTQEEVRESTQETIQSARELLAQEQRDYQQQMAARIDAIERHIHALKRELQAAAPPQMATEFEQTLNRLEQQLSSLRTNVQAETAESREAWNELKAGLDRAIETLEASTEEARQQLKVEQTGQPENPQAPSRGEVPPDTSSEAPATSESTS